MLLSFPFAGLFRHWTLPASSPTLRPFFFFIVSFLVRPLPALPLLPFPPSAPYLPFPFSFSHYARVRPISQFLPAPPPSLVLSCPFTPAPVPPRSAENSTCDHRLTQVSPDRITFLHHACLKASSTSGSTSFLMVRYRDLSSRSISHSTF